MDQQRLTYVWQQYLRQTATKAELQELEQALVDPVWAASIKELLSDTYQQMPAPSPGIGDAVKERIYRYITGQPQKHNRWSISLWIPAAAVLLLAILTALYVYPGLVLHRNAKIVNEIRPGGNRATLTLADGTKINLDSAKAGIQIKDKDISYNDGTMLGAKSIVNPKAVNDANGKQQTINNTPILTLTTPKGGQYQVILEDGTKVWLNAASSLKYPAKFTGDKREVELEGEAYFEVAKSDPGRPASLLRPEKAKSLFVVKSRGQEIIVLGTEFNVAAYADETSVKTTLVNGTVQVSVHDRSNNGPILNKRLSPGEQAIVSTKGMISKHKADLESEISWKNGYFSFKDEPLQDIMRKLSRWYNIEIAYEGPVPADLYNGTVGRDKGIKQVLNILSATQTVHFSIEGRKVIVMK